MSLHSFRNFQGCNLHSKLSFQNFFTFWTEIWFEFVLRALRQATGAWNFQEAPALGCGGTERSSMPIIKPAPGRSSPPPGVSFDGRSAGSQFWGKATALVKMCPHVKPGGGVCGLEPKHCFCTCLLCGVPLCTTPAA